MHVILTVETAPEYEERVASRMIGFVSRAEAHSVLDQMFNVVERTDAEKKDRELQASS